MEKLHKNPVDVTVVDIMDVKLEYVLVVTDNLVFGFLKAVLSDVKNVMVILNIQMVKVCVTMVLNQLLMILNNVQ